MEAQEVSVGEFDNERYTEVAQRDLEMVEINANIIKNDNDVFIFFSDEADGAQIVISGTQVEKAKRILDTKFVY
ncbi:MAG: hypothetical protein IPJ23_11020 [Ignavibacteriales bacterium]|nr:hypothetical protein [Ignavibacteriales bacterium]